MIGEEILMNYGVAGFMILYFIYDKISFQKGFKEQMTKLINNNTIALTKVYGVLSKCNK